MVVSMNAKKNLCLMYPLNELDLAPCDGFCVPRAVFGPAPKALHRVRNSVSPHL